MAQLIPPTTPVPKRGQQQKQAIPKCGAAAKLLSRGRPNTHGKTGNAPYADTPVSTPAALLRVPSLRSAKDAEPSTETMTKQTTIRQTNGRRKTENTIISASTAAAHIWTKQIAPGELPPVQNRRPVMSAVTHTAMPSVTISAVTLTPTTKTVTGISATVTAATKPIPHKATVLQLTAPTTTPPVPMTAQKPPNATTAKQPIQELMQAAQQVMTGTSRCGTGRRTEKPAQ